MSVSIESNDGQRQASGGKASGSKSRFQHNVLTVAGITFVFMGLVVLPQTRASVWSPSTVGYSDFMVGP